MIGLTPRQAEALAFIESFIAEHRYSPSIGEIAAGTKQQKSGAQRCVDGLVTRGRLRRRALSARSLDIVREAAATCPHCGSEAGSSACLEAAKSERLAPHVRKRPRVGLAAP